MSKSVEQIKVMVVNDIINFLDNVKGKPFPSEMKTADVKMFSFSTFVTGTEFKVSVVAQKTELAGKFLVYITSAFMSEPKVKDTITIHGVPLHGTYECPHALENIEDEDQLDNKIYDLIEETIGHHVTHAL